MGHRFVGEYTATFVVPGDVLVAFTRSHTFWRDLGYTLAARAAYADKEKYLWFKKGRKRRNLYTFSYTQAYKEVVLRFSGKGSGQTVVDVCFSVPWLMLDPDTRRSIRSTVSSYIRQLTASSKRMPILSSEEEAWLVQRTGESGMPLA